MALDKKLAREMLRQMVTIRCFEEKAIELSQLGLIGGAAHPCIGQEAVAVGAIAALEPGDMISSTHRGHGHCIAKGGDLKLMMAELLGRSTGYCKGKGGSMHIADVEIGILGANGIVGAGIPIAVGAAIASDVFENGKVTLCFFGDGASNTGSFHEAINMASIWRLPVVFVCENNNYAVSTSFSESSCVDIFDRAIGYGISGRPADGNDVEDVYNEVKKAARRAREGDGPSIIEAKTYRIEGHYIGDPAAYRPNGELEVWKEKDPIKRFEEKLLKRKLMSKSAIDRLKAEAEERLDEAVEFAKNSPFPEVEELFEDVYG